MVHKNLGRSDRGCCLLGTGLQAPLSVPHVEADPSESAPRGRDTRQWMGRGGTCLSSGAGGDPVLGGLAEFPFGLLIQ